MKKTRIKQNLSDRMMRPEVCDECDSKDIICVAKLGDKATYRCRNCDKRWAGIYVR